MRDVTFLDSSQAECPIESPHFIEDDSHPWHIIEFRRQCKKMKTKKNIKIQKTYFFRFERPSY